MTKGVYINSFDKPIYAYLAYNLAFSIKYFDPEMHITLCTDGNVNALDENRKKVFDSIIQMPHEFKYTGNVFDPGRAKVLSYDLLPYDYTLYLDVDAVAMQSIEPIFDELIKDGGYYYTHLYGFHKFEDGENMECNYWANKSIVWKHFNLNEKSVFPGCNTSIQFIKKCKEAKTLTDKIKDNFLNPIPLTQLNTQWGGGQPDELYTSGAMAQVGITGQMPKQFMFFGNEIDKRNTDQIKKDHNLLSVYGGKLFTKPIYTDLYDRILNDLHINKRSEHAFKHANIVGSKHANKRPLTTLFERNIHKEVVSQPVIINQTIERPGYNSKYKMPVLVSGDFPISETKLIDASKLISTYPSENGRPIRVTNWLNCSFINYKGKNILCYRMESEPFCTVMKLGICELDENFEPIQSTNKVLNLHSDLQGFAKGFHVEDPRLFVYNDKLFLSYTDGYQMLQASINHETFEATDSFYLDKPQGAGTEKNWTFFEHENKLYCLYDIPSMTIFEMDGSKHKQVYKTEYENKWNFGTIRGGTSPVKVGQNYLTFFHSSIDMHSKGVHGRQYYMGAMLFEGKPPFAPIAISKRPIIAGEYITESLKRLSNKIFVVFPAGVIRKKDCWSVSFGYNDLQCRYIDIPDDYLSKCFLKIEQKELSC